MTKQKTFKRRVRERMEQTGEPYATARAQLTGSDRSLPAGIHPHCASLRIALADAGLAVSEELVLLMTGGAGAAAVAFRYEAEDFTSFHLSGWNPFQSDIRDAVRRLGLEPDIHETTGAVGAEKALRERLAGGRVQVAWVEEYRVIVVLELDDDAALIADRAPQPIRIGGEELAARRGRVRKDRHRLLAIGDGEPDVAAAVRAGLARCTAGPEKPPMVGMSLEGIARWAERLHGGRGKESWARRFPPGKHLLGALRSTHAGIEAYGGGLMRPMQARGLREAAALLDMPALLEIADRTDALASRWSALADVASRGGDDVGALLADLQRRARGLYEEELATRESLAAVL
jgi:Domain of unknown function (DUF4872)